MPEISAFRGLRYDLGHVGALSDVIAPPYDVIGPELQEQLYARSPANVIRLILNQVEDSDSERNNRYTRAAKQLKSWRREGVLQQEPDPALYVYHQLFAFGGQEFTRRGFMGRVRLERFGEGKIYPHEETHSAAKADRLRLITATQANLSQIFGLYPDPENTAQQLLEDAISGATPLEATDHLGVVHRLWPVSDVRVIGAVAAEMDAKPMYVADGHHRYETACNYRDQLAAESDLDSEHPANFVLTMLVSMNDPGMVVLPTHRLFRGLPQASCEELASRLRGCFQVEDGGQGPERADALWEVIDQEQDQGTLALHSAKDDRWLLLRLADPGRQRMAEIASEHSVPWQGLGVAVLQRLIVEDLLQAGDLPKPEYVHQVSEVVDLLRSGDEDGQSFPLAALVMPATLEQIRQISEAGERMPAKSTYFYPKLLSGLVINPLD